MDFEAYQVMVPAEDYASANRDYASNTLLC